MSGKVDSVFAGADAWYGVRFYLETTVDNTGDHCNSMFAYTEPADSNGHEAMVSVFLAGYLSEKTLNLSVVRGRNGFCKIVEGSISN